MVEIYYHCVLQSFIITLSTFGLLIYLSHFQPTDILVYRESVVNGQLGFLSKAFARFNCFLNMSYQHLSIICSLMVRTHLLTAIVSLDMDLSFSNFFVTSPPAIAVAPQEAK